MDKKQAMDLIYDKYNEIKRIVYQLEKQHFQKNNTKKGEYFEDITHDLYIRLDSDLSKIEKKPHLIYKFLDRIVNGQMYIIYNMAKQMYVNFLKRENKYVTLNYKQMSDSEKKQLIEMPRVFEKEENIYQQVDDYVNTFYWFDRKLFDLYRYEFKLHKTNMSVKTRISYSTIYRTVKRCKVKIKDRLKDQYYE
jgi:hypothetical protein